MNFDLQPYHVLAGLQYWFVVMLFLLLAFCFVGLLTSFLTSGFSLKGMTGGLGRFFKQLGGLAVDYVKMSPKRIWALAMLTFREAIRRKALMVFIIFGVLFMFAGWFLSQSNDRPDLLVKVYVKFVLTAISWMLMIVILLLACWGIPQDIKARSLHTVVTKPARRNEVVIGRILGFTLISTLLLLVMGAIGYVWITRQIQATSAADRLVSRVPVYGHLMFTDRKGKPALKGVNTGDIWEFRSYIQGATDASAIWSFKDITPERIERDGSKVLLELNFESFRTHKGTIGEGLNCLLRLTNRYQREFAWGLSAHPFFEAVSPLIRSKEYHNAADEIGSVADKLEENLLGSHLAKQEQEMLKSNPALNLPNAKDNTIRSVEYDRIAQGYRQAQQVLEGIATALEKKKTDTEWTSGLISSLKDCVTQAERCRDTSPVTDSERIGLAKALRSFAEQLRSQSEHLTLHLKDLLVPLPTFEVKEFADNLITIDRKLTYTDEDGDFQTADLYDDLVRENTLVVEAQCIDPGQYLGMSRVDLFIRTPDRSFFSGYAKALFGIWLSMLMVISIGVCLSCFVNGPVAAFITAALIIMGTYSRNLIHELVTGTYVGGGPVETYYRIIKHLNPQVPMEPGFTTNVVRMIDGVAIQFLNVMKEIIPNFGYVQTHPQFVANGYDIPWSSALLPSIMIALGLLIPAVIIGHISLKLREIEAK